MNCGCGRRAAFLIAGQNTVLWACDDHLAGAVTAATPVLGAVAHVTRIRPPGEKLEKP